MSGELLTVKEVSEYLSLHEKKIYALAKAHKIPCTKVTGKWLFPKKLIDEWIISTARENIGRSQTAKKPSANIIFHGSNDLLIEVLGSFFRRTQPGCSLSISNVGSIGGLVSLRNGICHLTGIHLFDPDNRSDELERLLEEMDVVFVRLARRKQGLMVAPGNPEKIENLADLTKPGIRYVNRQAGSGTRILFDRKLEEENLNGSMVEGYENEVFTHFEVAMEVFSGHANAGMGIYSAAHTFKLDFIPVADESYNFVIPKSTFFDREIQSLLKIVRSEEFREKAKQLGGYDLTESGEIISL
jgi:excisionase family DNA binding protein